MASSVNNELGFSGLVSGAKILLVKTPLTSKPVLILDLALVDLAPIAIYIDID